MVDASNFEYRSEAITTEVWCRRGRGARYFRIIVLSKKNSVVGFAICSGLSLRIRRTKRETSFTEHITGNTVHGLVVRRPHTYLITSDVSAGAETRVTNIALVSRLPTGRQNADKRIGRPTNRTGLSLMSNGRRGLCHGDAAFGENRRTESRPGDRLRPADSTYLLDRRPSNPTA